MTDRIPPNATPEQVYLYEERAAIIEHDGQQSREDAEFQAVREVWPEEYPSAEPASHGQEAPQTRLPPHP